MKKRNWKFFENKQKEGWAMQPEKKIEKKEEAISESRTKDAKSPKRVKAL